MEEMSVDRLLGIGGLAVGIVGLIVAIAVPIYFYRKGLRPKLLAVAYNGEFSLMLSVPGVTVSYLGATRAALSRTNILFWNRGTAPIEESDFIVPISFTGAEVLKIEIIVKDPMAIAEVSGHALKIILLRPSEAIVVKVEVEQFSRPNLMVPTKSENMVETIRRVPGVLGILPVASMVVFGLISFGAGVALTHHLELDPPTHSLIPFLVSMGSIAIAVPGYAVGIRIVKKLTPIIPYAFLATDLRDVSTVKPPHSGGD
jgi:hypothetical protein